MPKIISNEVRDMVMKVYEFCREEKRNRGAIIPFKKVNERVVHATGISLRTLSRIIKEGTLPEGSRFPKKKKVRKDKIVLGNHEISALRQKVHEYYYVKKELPTIRKLHEELKQEIGYKGSREILRRHLLEIGFRFGKPKPSKVKEPPQNIDLSATDYLEVIQQDQPEPDKQLPIVYIDETFILSEDVPSRSCLMDNEAVIVEVTHTITKDDEQC